MDLSANSRENELWNFSLGVYSAPGVAEECIGLQDRFGIDVNLLLFCAWIAWSRKIKLTSEDIEALEAVVKPWHEATVKPLRAVRRYLKDISDGDIAALRKQVKAAELEAERMEQAMLFSTTGGRWSRVENNTVSVALRCNLELFLRKQAGWVAADEPNPVPCLTAATLALDHRS